MNKKEKEIEAAYREREIQEQLKIDALTDALEKEQLLREEQEYYSSMLREDEIEAEKAKKGKEEQAKRDAEIEASVEKFFNKENEESTPIQRHLSVDYEALTMKAIMNGDGDILGYD